MRSVLSLLSTFPLLTASAFGWGCEGHQMIALIARAHLAPDVSLAVDRLLRENPIDPALNRFCRDRPSDIMADSSTWADDAKTIEKTADWHFIDIPLAVNSAGQDVMKWCQSGCIVSAIEREGAILRDRSQPAPLRARALRYMIHFVGDLSQPLHANDNRDRGGNCTQIRFFPDGKDGKDGKDAKPENLHAIWDYKIIARDLETRKATQAQYARTLDEEFARNWLAWGESKPDILAWTWDSHTLASTVTYADLKPAIPVASPNAGLADDAACTAGRAAVAALRISIDDEYLSQALPVIREQLAKAGYRLAGLLNQTLQ